MGESNTSDPQFQEACAYYAAGRLAEAEQLCRSILIRDLCHADSLHLLGIIAHRSGDSAAARELIGKAAAINPHEAHYQNSLGNVYGDLGDVAEAVACYARAVSLRPGFADAYYNLGNCHAREERFQEAELCYRAALQLCPVHAASWVNLGNALRALGRVKEALECYRQPEVGAPQFAEARWNEALARLLDGDYLVGWELYEWRWRLERAKSRGRNFSKPLWDGSDVGGRSLLVYSEQGFGDAIQFARYLPLAKARNANILFECPTPLLRFFRDLPSVEQVFATGDALPPFDLQVPLLSLPRIFRTTLDNIPPPLPVSVTSNKWKAKVAAKRKGLCVGLAWAGGTSDVKRDCPLKLFGLLGARRGAIFFSLQKGPAASQANVALPGMELHDYTAELNDFADTAALISELDLVICTDTAVAHLAASLDKPTWVLLRYAADWRWLRTRDDSPWYSAVRLFRQERPGDWVKPMHRIATLLAQFIVDAKR